MKVYQKRERPPLRVGSATAAGESDLTFCRFCPSLLDGLIAWQVGNDVVEGVVELVLGNLQ